MTVHFGWPQAIVVTLWLVRLIDCTIHHGESDGKKNAWSTLIVAPIVFALLWWGGFFGQ